MKIEPVLSILEKKPGESIVYYRGFMIYDRAPQPGHRRTQKHARVVEIANTAWELFEQGKVTLVQRRYKMPATPRDIGSFEYIAVRNADKSAIRVDARYGKAA